MSPSAKCMIWVTLPKNWGIGLVSTKIRHAAFALWPYRSWPNTSGIPHAAIYSSARCNSPTIISRKPPGLKVDAPLSWTPLSPSPLPRMTPVSTKTEVMLQRLYKSKSLVQWHDLQFLLSNDTLKVKDIHHSEIVLNSHSYDHPRRAQTPPSLLRLIRQEEEGERRARRQVLHSVIGLVCSPFKPKS